MFYLFLLKFLWASWDFKSLHQLLEGGGSGNWSKGDTRLFLAMIFCGIFALTLSFSPIFLISELQPFSEKVDNILYFSSLLIFFVSYIALFKFIPANWRDPDFSKKKKVIIFVG